MITRLKNILECSINRMQMRIWYIKKGKVKKKFYPPKEYRKKKKRSKATMKTNRKSDSRRVGSLSRFQSVFFIELATRYSIRISRTSWNRVCKRRAATRGQFRIKPFLPFVRKGCLQPGVVAIAGGDRIRGRMGSC